MNNHIITWLRIRLVKANALSQHTEKSRVQRKLLRELALQLG